jgi:succinate dehydrogenase/fumarate reductase-like Fe-S protein
MRIEMVQKNINVEVFRFNPSKEEEPRYQTYEVPLLPEMNILDVLDYIYENLDNSLAYYSHTACRRGVCARCTLRVNSKSCLACKTLASGDLIIEPPPKFKVVRDLVYLTTQKE